MMVESAAAVAGQARQAMQENEQDRITRDHANFSQFEAKMPGLIGRSPASFKDNITSYLGRNNPFYQHANPKTDYVWLLDNTAFQSHTGIWRAEFVAAYFAKNSGKRLSETVSWISEMVGLADDDEARKTIAQRVQPFLDAVLPARAIQVDVQGTCIRLGPSGREGISSDQLALPGSGYGDADMVTLDPPGDGTTNVNITFAKSEGWAVVSDIDDTIKLTMTSSPTGILKTTFAQQPQPIRGMPELYKYMSEKLQNPPFWYLSASPYNLYPFLRQFRDAYYPNGTLILRNSSWMSLAGLFANLTQGTEAYKVERLEKIKQWFPRRKFILLGDSTQSDPEAYGEMYRRHPEWVGKIFIRKVTGIAAAEMDEEKKNSVGRFEKAFQGVARDVWHVFNDPQEVHAKIEALSVLV